MKWTCSVCGYVHEGPEAPDFCPQCKAPKEKFVEVKEGAREWKYVEIRSFSGVSSLLRHPIR